MQSVALKLFITEEWRLLLGDKFCGNTLDKILDEVSKASELGDVFPPPSRVFRALNECKPDGVRVVILGQDPYHTHGVADGLAFSSFPNNPVPPSLENIFKEIDIEFGGRCARNPDLTKWASQGVLLLNTSLTVVSGKANSHSTLGWSDFADAILIGLSNEYKHIVFMLWGKNARLKRANIDASNHLILESPHPSPLSAHRGFIGNGHFRKANEYLEMHKLGSITWC